jgi:hypothetical protein
MEGGRGSSYCYPEHSGVILSEAKEPKSNHASFASLRMTLARFLSLDLFQIHRPPARPTHDQIEIPIPVEVTGRRSRQ